jgi:single-stranded-DNA-specific exonuclease
MNQASIVENNVINGESGYFWQLHKLSNRDVQFLIQKFDLPEVIARIILARINHISEVENYLNPKIKNTMPDPFHLKDMDIAANRLVNAIKNREKIAIFGDYDVDGATSSSLLKKFFAHFNIDAFIYIPDRIKEGYGPNIHAFDYIKSQGYNLVITVDCGTLAFEPVDHANKIGLEVIILDHHLSDITMPKALAVVNPNRIDQSSELTYLAAVGVCFITCVAITKLLRDEFYFDEIKEPDLLNMLDLVALGTVCDVVPLKNLNRAMVKQGIRVIAKRSNQGIAAIADVAAIGEIATCYHLGFVIGPRINAGGRVGESYLGAQILSSNDYLESTEIARKLNRYNEERKAIESLIIDEALKLAESQAQNNVIIITGEGWHHGVIGIVCSRVKEKFNRPVAVISFDENNIGKASARSIKGVDFGASVVAAKNQDLLIAGGGHAMAAGFSIHKDKLTEFSQFLSNQFSKQINNYGDLNYKDFDAYLDLGGVTLDLAKQIANLSPFGSGNEEPRFAIINCFVVKIDIIANSHLRLFLVSKFSENAIKATLFRAIDSDIGQKLINSNKKMINLIAKIKINNWQSRESVELIIDDYYHS